MKVKFILERETLNTVRYAEEPPADGSAVVIGTLYVKKAALKEFEKVKGTGFPEYLYLDIEAG